MVKESSESSLPRRLETGMVIVTASDDRTLFSETGTIAVGDSNDSAFFSVMENGTVTVTDCSDGQFLNAGMFTDFRDVQSAKEKS